MIRRVIYECITGLTGLHKTLRNNGEQWKINVASLFSYIFQYTSCYLVLLIVGLRLSIVKNPIDFDSFHKKITKWACMFIWVFALGLNALCSFVPPSNPKDPENVAENILTFENIRCHVGVTLPIFFSILVIVYLRIYLERSAFSARNELNKKEQKTKTSFQKLINGLVIWLIVCNVPFIAWYHYAIYCYNATDGKSPWMGISGVILFFVPSVICYFHYKKIYSA